MPRVGGTGRVGSSPTNSPLRRFCTPPLPRPAHTICLCPSPVVPVRLQSPPLPRIPGPRGRPALPAPPDLPVRWTAIGLHAASGVVQRRGREGGPGEVRVDPEAARAGDAQAKMIAQAGQELAAGPDPGPGRGLELDPDRAQDQDPQLGRGPARAVDPGPERGPGHRLGLDRERGDGRGPALDPGRGPAVGLDLAGVPVRRREGVVADSRVAVRARSPRRISRPNDVRARGRAVLVMRRDSRRRPSGLRGPRPSPRRPSRGRSGSRRCLPMRGSPRGVSPRS